MPNRYIREGIITSEAVCSLTWPAEVFYRRLLNKVDDFGRYTAHPALLRAALYPLQLEKVREADMPRFLAECETAGLMSVYRVESKPYLALYKWERGRATASHYPDPPARLPDSGEPLASGGKFSGSTGGLGDVSGIAPKLGAGAPENPPTPIPTTIEPPLLRSGAPKSKAEVLTEAERFMPTSSVRDKPDAGFVDWWWDEQEKRGWVDPQSGLPWHDWKAAFTGAWRACSHRTIERKSKTYGPNQQPNGRNNGTPSGAAKLRNSD